MFLFRDDIRRMKIHGMIPVFSGRDGCLEFWPDSCRIGQGGRYPRIPPAIRRLILADYAARVPLGEIEKKYGIRRTVVWQIRRMSDVPTAYRTQKRKRRPQLPELYFEESDTLEIRNG